MKLNAKAFALTNGILWGLGLFLVTWWKILFHRASGNPTFIGKVLFGYQIDPLGSVIGLVWAFVLGAIAGFVFAWLYNKLAAGKKE